MKITLIFLENEKGFKMSKMDWEKEYDEEKCCRNCVYLKYDSFHDDLHCRNKESGIGLTDYDNECDYFFHEDHNLNPNKFKVRLDINLKLEKEVEAETEEKALSLFKQRLSYNFDFLKGCNEEVEKIKDGDKNYPYINGV